VAFTANDYILDAAELYGDTAYIRVTQATWIKYLNSAVRALILVRPDAGAVTESVQLVAGIKQTLPAVSLRLLDISRNLGADGLTAGKIVTPANRQHIDYANLLWPANAGDTSVENFSYDSNVPRIYYVTPPVIGTTDVYVEMSSSQLPTAMTTISSDDGIDDVFFEAIIQFILYKAFAADDESVEWEKSQKYYTNFLQLLGIEIQASKATGPERKE
jgi:hypothetical protein